MDLGRGGDGEGAACSWSVGADEEAAFQQLADLNLYNRWQGLPERRRVWRWSPPGSVSSTSKFFIQATGVARRAPGRTWHVYQRSPCRVVF